MSAPDADGAPRAPAADTRQEQRVALGEALVARSDDVGSQVAAGFPAFLRTEALAASSLATRLVGRWLATGVVASAEEKSTLSRQGQQAVLMEVAVSSVVTGYLRWRDVCSSTAREEGTRLGTGADLLDVTATVIQMSCDAGLVRAVRSYDETRSILQERRRAEQEDASSHALHDQLTGLPNRTLLVDRLRRASRSARRSGAEPMLLFLDLDNFQAINDRFGRPAGDRMLTTVATRLVELVRASDTVARLGGDEFAVLVEDVEGSPAPAQSLAERIHQSMRAPVLIDERELHTSVSIGIASVTPDADPELCLARADAAMYQAKRSGSAPVDLFSATNDDDGSRHESLVADELRMAHGRGELSLDYQPLFRLENGQPGRLVGMEALLRWTHPALGQIPPDQFVPFLERSRQIVPVGRWVLEEAAFQCRDWHAEGFPELAVSVNVSTRQLQDPAFVADVQDALIGAGLEPAHLVLEITESVLMVDTGQIAGVLEQLREVGVQLALDDFGTGHSSLLHIQHLPIDRLKIDRSFVSGLDASHHDGSIIQTVVDLAHSLGISVVAVGVETPTELRAVCAVGCDAAQGFLLGRPAPSHRVTLDDAARQIDVSS